MMTGEAAEREADGAGPGGAGPSRAYVCPARDQLLLMPVSMRDWLEEGHLAWFVLDVVKGMDTGAVHRRPGGCAGRPPYEPEMMVAVLLYGYCCGIRSSRRIESSCRTDAAFRVVCGGLVPDHATIARFVVDREQALEGLFVEGLRLCAAAGLADLAVVALDGTKIAADVSLARDRDAVWIGREVAKLMAVTGEHDQQPAAAAGTDALPGVEPVAEISSPAGRLARLKAALAVIEAEDAAAEAQAARQAHAAAVEAEQGRQVTGRTPKQPQAARGEKLPAAPPCRIERAKGVLARAEAALQGAQHAVTAAPTSARRVNVTDPDSRIMNTKDGWVQAITRRRSPTPNRSCSPAMSAKTPAMSGSFGR
jgi:transposase